LERIAQVPYFAGAYSSLGGTMSSINCDTPNEYRLGKGINPSRHLTKTNRSLISCPDSGAPLKFRISPAGALLHKFGGSSE